MNYVRLGLYAAGAAALVALFLMVNGWRKDSNALPEARKETRMVITAFTKYQTDMRAELSRVTANATGYHNELETLRADRARPVTLRVCNVTPRPGAAVASDPAPGAGTDARPGATGDVPGATAGNRPEGYDAGPELEALARDADDTLALARALQDYIRGLPASCAGS